MSSASVRVWVADDGVRVNPETGRYFEDRPDIHADYPTGGYQQSNAVWSSKDRRVTLRAARNEFVSFQIIVEAGGGAEGIKVSFDSLLGPGGAKIDGPNVALFKAWCAHVTKASTGYEDTSLGAGWYPDALIPSHEPGRVSFNIPDKFNAIGAGQRNQTVWVDVYVPRDAADAPPGDYEGVVTVDFPDGRTEIAVTLKVWNFALPEEIHCRGDIYNRSLGEMPPQQELGYYHMAHRHRFHPGVPTYKPQLEVDGADVRIDWSEYDGRLRKYFDGSAFTAEHGYWGPGEGAPIPHVILPFDINKRNQTGRAWPIPIGEDGRSENYEAVWVEAARQFKEHFEADPIWSKVRRIVFLDGLDESYNEEAYEKMRYYCDLLRKGMGADWFQYRIDGGYSGEAMETLYKHVGLWICHTIGFDHDKMAHYRALGVEPWFYGPMIYERQANSACGSNTFTDLDLLTCRGMGWAAWKHRCGYCQWEFDSYWDMAADCYDPAMNWKDAINFRKKGREFNGSGLLIYRGEAIGLDEPVPSIRLKAHRRGFQDYEYFWMLADAGKQAQADELVDSVVYATPFGRESVGNIEIWKNNSQAWDDARIQAGHTLHRLA